jgi:hypothetical protein
MKIQKTIWGHPKQKQLSLFNEASKEWELFFG